MQKLQKAGSTWHAAAAPQLDGGTVDGQTDEQMGGWWVCGWVHRRGGVYVYGWDGGWGC